MKTVEINGKTFELDDEGYLQNREDWTIDFAKEMAKKDDQELTEAHIWVIEFLRKYYEEYYICPAVRVLNKQVGKQFGLDKANSKYMYGLFPYGPAKQACRYAGTPKPTGCI